MLLYYNPIMLLSLLVILSTLHTMVVCLPVGTVNEADTATINNHPHEFMTILYECWNLKDDNINYKKCLEAMGEGDQIREIMNANEVTGLIGDVIKSKDNINAEYIPISFNFSSINSDGGLVKFSELRIHRQQMSTTYQPSITNNETCSLTEGINITLLAESSNGQLQLIEKQLIDKEKLMEDQWIVFRQIDDLIKSWQANRTKDCHTIYIGIEGACGSLDPTSMGINTIPHKFPLLAVFLDNINDMEEAQKMLQSLTPMIASQDRVKRHTTTTSKTDNILCELVNFTVKFADIGMGNAILSPKSYEANYCTGGCPYPISSKQNATLHSQIQAILNNKDPDIPEPCCTPTKLMSLGVLITLDSKTHQLKNFPNMTAIECGCR